MPAPVPHPCATPLRARQELGPLLHLAFIATAPEARGRGLGSSMLDHLARLADEQGRHIYLEASTEESRRLYARKGYRDMGSLHLDAGEGPVFYLMARAPRQEVGPQYPAAG